MPFSDDNWQRVSAVTVTHHSAAVIGACLRSVAPAGQIIVVDNASADQTRDIVRREAPTATLIHNAVGLGFGNGCNCGIRVAERDFLLMINPDAELEPGALEALLVAADRYPEAGILGPTILNPDGTVEPSHDDGLFERRPRGAEPPPEGDLCAAYLSGAVLMVRKTALDEVGGFDPAIFLYYEDDDLCYRFRAKGWSLVRVAAARVRHVGGGSIGSGWDRLWEKFWHMSWSRLYIEEKYHGRAAMRRIAWPNVARFAAKSLGYLIVLNRRKLWRDLARFCGTAAYLLGRPATIPRPSASGA
ncbi:MAG: glycosyltransferase family 2 protein [Alphaproteobacteria bacterium]